MDNYKEKDKKKNNDIYIYYLIIFGIVSLMMFLIINILFNK